MTRGKSTDTATLDGGPRMAAADARFAELCGPEGADDEESAEDHPGYGSLLGLGVRKPAKKPVIVLDPEVAEQAAQVMEINAGQLVVRGGQPAQGFGSLGLGALGEDGDEDAAFGTFDAAEGPEPAYEEEHGEPGPAVAEWSARVPGSGDDEKVEAEEAVWPNVVEPTALGEVCEPPVEATVVWHDEPAVEQAIPKEPAVEQPAYEEPVHEEAVVEQAWLDWARTLVEPSVPAGDAPLLENAEEPDEFDDPEALIHPADEIEPLEPALPKHELRQLLAQNSHPHPHPSRRLWRQLLAFLKRLFA